MKTLAHTNEDACGALLMDLICYELRGGRLSPEIKYLFERHLEQCPSCRQRYTGFLDLLEEDNAVRNFG